MSCSKRCASAREPIRCGRKNTLGSDYLADATIQPRQRPVHRFAASKAMRHSLAIESDQVADSLKQCSDAMCPNACSL